MDSTFARMETQHHLSERYEATRSFVFDDHALIKSSVLLSVDVSGSFAVVRIDLCAYSPRRPSTIDQIGFAVDHCCFLTRKINGCSSDVARDTQDVQ
jgi:hypothetical protein